MKAGTFALLFAGWTAACSVPTITEQKPEALVNSCTSDSDCGGGRCVGSACRANAGEIDQIILEVAVPTQYTAAKFSGMQFLVSSDGFSSVGGALPLRAPAMVDVSGVLLPPPCQTVGPYSEPVARNAAGSCPDNSIPIPLPACRTKDGGVLAREASGSCPSGSTAKFCRYDFSEYGARLTFTPLEFPRGIGLKSLSTTISADKSTGTPDDTSGQGQFKITLPKWIYSVQVTPQAAKSATSTGALSDDICPITPQALQLDLRDPEGTPPDSRNSISQIAQLTLSPYTWLRAKVQWPTTKPTNPGSDSWQWGEGALKGWRIDVLEPIQSLPVSPEVVLADPVPVEPGLESYSVEVPFSPTPDVNGHLGQEVVRLRPPNGTANSSGSTENSPIAPMFLIERSALELVAGQEATLKHVRSVPGTVKIGGHLLGCSGPDDLFCDVPVAGTVTLEAKSLDGVEPGTLAYFKTSMEMPLNAADPGQFVANVPPGKYRVLAGPQSSCPDVLVCSASDSLCECPLAAVEDEWAVSSASQQEGKTVLLHWGIPFTGVASDFLGRPLRGAALHATPVSSSRLSTVLSSSLALDESVARGHSATAGANGSFGIHVESGSYDLSVRPVSDQGFPWLVRPNLAVTTATPPDLDLHLPLPVVYDGTLSVPDGKVLTSTVIRAYVWVRDSSDAGSRVVQVAETRTDGSGNFRLLLPEMLAND